MMSETNYQYYKQAQAIKEKKRLAEQRQADERAAQLKARKERTPYSDRLAGEICSRIAGGELLTVICLDPHMPTPRLVTQWLKAHQDFAALYQQSLQDRLLIFEEQVIEFADSIPKEPQRMTAKNTKEKIQFVDPVARAKLQIEIRMRHLKAGRPQKWGDASTLTVKQEDPFDCSTLSSEEIERRIAEIEHKEAIMRNNRPKLVEKTDLF